MTRRDERLTEELQFHLEQLIAKHVRRGASADEARRLALIEFGGVEPAREAARDQWRGAWLADLVRDMRVGARALVRLPGYASATILTMALGIGAASAMYSVFDGVLLRPLPYPEPDRIVHLYQLGESGARNRVSDPNFDDWVQGTTSFEVMATYTPLGPLPLVGAGEAQLARTTMVSRDFFDVMGVRPWLGRAFVDAEQQPGGPTAVVVSAALWRRWKGDAPPGGEVVRTGSSSYTVIGVMPDGFDYPSATAVWIARGVLPANRSRTSHNALGLARVRPDVSVAAANAEISRLSRQLKTEYGDDTWMADAAAVPVLEVVTAASKDTLGLLLAASLLLLVVAGVNVSNLLIARAASRRAEFGVQLALGATEGRIGRQLLAETLVICLAGAAVGVALATFAVRLFVAYGPDTVQRLDAVRVSWPAVVFAIASSMIAALVLSALTATGVRRTRIAAALSDQTRSGTGGRAQLRVREGLIVVQVGLTLVLLSGAALLGRSLERVTTVDPGYAIRDGLVVGLTIAGDGTPEAMARQVALQDQVLARMAAQPGTTHVGLVSAFPIGAVASRFGVFIEMTRPDEITSFDQFDPTAPDLRSRAGEAEYRHVSGEYFQAMGIPLLDGRLIDDRDGPQAPHVGVVSESLARAEWPDRSALGRWIQFGNMDGDLRTIQIVGVVGDVREGSPESRPDPTLYVSARQRPRQASRAWVIASGPATPALGETARRIVRDIDPEVPSTITTVAEAFDDLFTGRRFILWLVGTFSAVALLLATLGVYGLFAYAVSRRTREMGIRLALGAEPRSLVWLVVRRGVWLTAIGLAAGLAVSTVATGAMTSLLFEVSPGDPAALAVAILVVAVTSVLAALLPSRRLLAQSPARTLRDV